MTKSIYSEEYRRFRELLIQTRKSCGLSQVELSQMLGRPQSFVSKYERGERRLDVIEFLKIAKVLGIDPFKFLEKLEKTQS